MAGVRRVSDITTVPYNVRVLVFHNTYIGWHIGIYRPICHPISPHFSSYMLLCMSAEGTLYTSYTI